MSDAGLPDPLHSVPNVVQGGTDHDLLLRIDGNVSRLVIDMRDHERRLTDLERWRERHTVEANDRDKDLDEIEPEVRSFHDLKVRLDTLTTLVNRVQWGVVAAVVVSVLVFIVETFLPHVSGVPVINP